MNFDFIVDHALRNVWGTPSQDTQYIVTPAKLTGGNGLRNTVQVLWSQYPLPDTISRWHVYQIGGIQPTAAFNLFVRCAQWVSLAEACNTNKIVANVYTESGVQYPLHNTYYRYTESGNVILAVMVNEKIPVNLRSEAIHVRLYTNAYYNSTRSAGLTEELTITSKTMEIVSDIADIVDIYNTQATGVGQVFVVVNGLARSTLNAGMLTIGSEVTLTYDPSVYKVLRFPVTELDDFESTLDLKRKYLLHYPGNIERIDFQDDIDVYVVEKAINDTYRGVYCNKNNPDALRNVTHKDYSVPTTYVKRHTETVDALFNRPSPMDMDDMFIELYIRNAGWDRPLVFDNNRIHELYKMSDENIYKAMIGIDATVPYWTPAVLEHSMYTFIMRAECSAITNPVVEAAYGYNTISSLVANTPNAAVVAGADKVVEVPYKLQFGCTAYEYDADGILIDWHHHYVGSSYVVKIPNCTDVELIAGLGGSVLDEVYDARDFMLKDKHSYRVYLSRAVAGVSDNKWIDVTDNPTYYKVQNNHYQWIDTSATSYPMVRSDARFLAIDTELFMEEGVLKFTLKHLQTRGENTSPWIMQIPLGQMDVWINGKSAIRGLDYFGEFPNFHIVSKKHLSYPLTNPQQVHIRFVGHCTPQMTMLPEGDIGFVEHGVLSNNSRYDIRDDKVLRIVVGGALKKKSDFTFSEFHSGVAVSDPLNGTPYMVKDLYVPVKQFTTKTTYELWSEAKYIDKKVSDYLTKKIPQPDRPAPSAIPHRYELFSPFCNKLILDLKYGRLNIPQKPGGYTRQDIVEFCAPYEHLLKYDPVHGDNTQDLRYVVIHPHGLTNPLSLLANEYRFMLQVVKHYTNDIVSLSSSVVVA